MNSGAIDLLVQDQALAYLRGDYPSNCALLEVLQRGSGEVLQASSQGVLLRDRRSGVYMLAADSAQAVLPWLVDLPDCSLFTTTLSEVIPELQARYGFTHAAPCLQYVYPGKTPPAVTAQIELQLVTPQELQLLGQIYALGSDEELAEARERGEVFAGHDPEGRTVGFIGVHGEGSMGMLEILPAFRRRGYGAAMESLLIGERLKGGHIPYCQVLLENTASMRLQEKLGLQLAQRRTTWLH